MPASLTATRLLGEAAAGGNLEPGSPLEVEVEWKSEDPGLHFHLAIAVDRNDGVQVCTFSTRHDGLPAFTGRGLYRLRLAVPALPMVRGAYELCIFLLDESALHVYDQRRVLDAFAIESEGYEVALLKVAHDWHEASDQEAGQPAPEPARALALH